MRMCPSDEMAEDLTSELELLHGRIRRLEESEDRLLKVLAKIRSREQTGRLVPESLGEPPAEPRESEDQCPVLLESANEAVIVEQDGALKFVNPRALALTGYSAEELIGMPFTRLIHPDDLGLVVDRRSGRPPHEQPSKIDSFRIVDKAGVTKWVEINTVRMHWQGDPATLSLLSDVSERKRTEEALQQSEQKYRTIFQYSPLGLVYFDKKGVITDFNGNFVSIIGSSREKLLGLNIMASVRNQRVLEAVRKALAGEVGHYEGEYASVTAPKSTLVKCEFSPLFADDGSLLGGMAIIEDVTERKRAEMALRRSKETVEALLNATTDIAFLADTRGRFLALNDTIAERLGHTIDELVGTGIFYRLPREIAATRMRRFETVVATGRSVRFEDDLDGRIYDNGLYPVFGPDGEVEKVAVFARDVTGQKKAQELFLQAERIKAVGEMSSGVAHNFNNLLQVVMGSAQMALTHLGLGNFSEIRRNLDQILDSARFGAETVKRLQDFARVRADQPMTDVRVFDLSESVRQAIAITMPWWKTSAEKEGIRISLCDSLEPRCFVLGKESEIFEVIVNLIKNAVEALPDGGNIAVRSAVEDRWVTLRVEDDGIGIDKEDMGRIFEPFWTTKGFKGTGMGLACSYGIVRRHDGEISVQSRRGQGSSFTVKLPPVPAKSRQPAQTGVAGLIFAPRILVIDDMLPVVELLAEALAGHCEEIFTALNGADGLALFEANRIDLVICDLGMEGMNGWQVGEAIKKVSQERGVPKPLFLLLTGWSGQARQKAKIIASGVDAIVEKPVDIPQLLSIAGELMEGRRKEPDA